MMRRKSFRDVPEVAIVGGMSRDKGREEFMTVSRQSIEKTTYIKNNNIKTSFAFLLLFFFIIGSGVLIH